MRVKKIEPIDCAKILEDLDVDSSGVAIMKKKMELFFVYIESLKSPAANILKQDALSIGADLAVPRDSITCKKEYVSGLLIANRKELEILAKKERIQPFGLKNLSFELERILKIEKEQKMPTLMGVLNINSNSFYDKSRCEISEIESRILRMIEDGASVIDIGATSSAPKEPLSNSKDELKKIEQVADIIYKKELYKKAEFSIDTYHYEVAKCALESGFSRVNDIFGFRDEKLLEVASQYRAKVVLMHMQGEPKNMQDNPSYEDVVLDIEEFFKRKIDILNKKGIFEIALDVGIGFGKRLEDNLMLLNELENFKKFGVDILIGASRKSLIDKIVPTSIEDRLPATLILHAEAYKNGANIIRCHDVKEHYLAFKVLSRLRGVA